MIKSMTTFNTTSDKHVVYYLNSEYEIYGFLDKHPGGRKVLEKYNSKDITKAFHNVGHSKEALQLLMKYKSGKQTHEKQEYDGLSYKEFITRKLFTQEDAFNMHKTLGLLSLLSFFYRYFYVFPTTGTLGFDGKLFDYLTFMLHMMLSSSSLVFHVLEKRLLKNPLIIYEEYRLHAILFSLRCVIVGMVGLLGSYFEPYQQIVLWLGMCGIHLAVDNVTEKYGTPGVTAVRANDPNNLKYVKLFYAYYQILAIGSHLTINPRLADLGFNTLIAIQSSAFMMTLKRKNIVRWTSYIFWYGLALLLSIVYIAKAKGFHFLALMLIPFIGRTQLGINKYIVWSLYVIIGRLLG